MNCDHIEPWISAYQDGELDARRRRFVEEHLECCPACAVLLRELEQLTTRLQESLTYEEAPETLHTRVMREIPEPEPALLSPGGFRPPRNWFSFGLVPIGAMSALLLLGPRQAPPPAPIRTQVTVTAPTEPADSGLGGQEAPVAQPPAGTEQPGNKTVRLPPVKVNPTEEVRPLKPPKAPAAPKAHRNRNRNRGEYRPDLEPLRELRRLRPRRRSYPMVQHQRRPRREPLVVHLPAPPSPSGISQRERHGPGPQENPSGLDSGAGSVGTRIAVVDYVLPEVQPAGAADSDPETRFVLRPADEPYEVSEALFDY